MKKILLSAVALLSTMLLPAQGVYQLWGMTPFGGPDNLGLLFNTDGKGNNFTIKHPFTTLNKGAHPNKDLIEFNGKVYGLTIEGGENDNGVLFEWDPASNHYEVKYNFNDADGNRPSGILTEFNQKLYGVTSGGGLHGAGVILEWDPAMNVYTKKVDLLMETGGNPMGSLTLYKGKFYGTTTYGGMYGYPGEDGDGVLFVWDPVSNIYNKLFDFNLLDGTNPFGNLYCYNGNLYGMASTGGTGDAGTIFEFDPETNQFSKKHDFSEESEGRLAYGNLVLVEDKFYGFTYRGGIAPYYSGVIFEWNPVTNNYSKKFDFDYTNGGTASGTLTYYNGKFYGMTESGGSFDMGVIFEWDPVTNIYTKKQDFDATNGGYPEGSLLLINNTFFGVTAHGGSLAGVIFEWNPASNQLSKKIDFNIRDGANPFGSLTACNGNLYGMSFYGGVENEGVIFEYDPLAEKFTKKIDIRPATMGSHPVAGLIPYNNKFYGMTNSLDGAIIEWDPVTNICSQKHRFIAIDGSSPNGNLGSADGKLYGTTFEGGGNNQSNARGLIFQYDPAPPPYTMDYEVKVTFTGVNGSNPNGTLTRYADKLYGLTAYGGSNQAGVIFEWDPVTNIFIKKFDFANSTGAVPFGNLTMVNGVFYGMTSKGGINDAGVIFEWNPLTNLFKKRFDFSLSNGGNPTGSLAFSGGNFYGLAPAGGNYGSGVIFEWNPSTNEYTKKKDFSGQDGANPGSDLTVLPAPVCNGTPGYCRSVQAVTINNSNNRQWVPITDDEGNVVAEIKANGNNLGILTTELFINNGPVREDLSKKLYLNRSITITPQNPPATPVDLRLYIKEAEYLTLKAAQNSGGDASGINHINDLGIYKLNVPCAAPAYALTDGVNSTVVSAWGNDYVLCASTGKLVTFYIANKNLCTAPVISDVLINLDTLWPPFHAYRGISIPYKVTGDCKCGTITNWLTVQSNEPQTGTGNLDLAPDWQISDEHHVKLRAERDDHGNGRVYSITIHSKNSTGHEATHELKVVVPLQLFAPLSKVITEANRMSLVTGDFNTNDLFNCNITPNPSAQHFTLQVSTTSVEKISATLLDMNGRVLETFQLTINNTLQFGETLKAGFYILKIVQAEKQQVIKIVKQ